MEIKIESASITYFDREESESTPLILRSDFEYLHIDFDRSKPKEDEHDNSTLTLTKHQVEVLRDSLSLMLKNKAFN